MKDLDPGVILNVDATTYKMGKDNFVQRVYFINGEDADDLGPLRRESNDKDKLGLYIKCMNIISAGEAVDFSSVHLLPQMGVSPLKFSSSMTLCCPRMTLSGMQRLLAYRPDAAKLVFLGWLAFGARASRAHHSSTGMFATWRSRISMSAGSIAPFLTRQCTILSTARPRL